MLRTERLGDLEIISASPPAGHSQPKTTPLLFVHGAFLGGWMWADNFLPWFAAHGYPCHAVSLRGHGGSGGRQELTNHSIADYVEDVVSVLDWLEQPTVLIGHSMGGFIVQKVLEERQLAGAALLCSVPPQGLMAAQFNMLLQKPELFIELNSILDGSNTNIEVVRDVLFAQPVSNAVLESFVDRMQSESQRALWDMSMFNMLSFFGRKRPPMLVLGAEKDALIAPLLAQTTAMSLGLSAQIFSGMGHAVTHEKDWPLVAASLAEWLETTLA